MRPVDRRAYLELAAAITGPIAGCRDLGSTNQEGDENTSTQDADDVTVETVTEEGEGNQDVNVGFNQAGSPPRTLVSTQDREIVVPRDHDTIQEAVDEIPLLMRHKLDVVIEPGEYDEDVIVPPFIGEWARPNQKELVPVRINGNQDDPSQVTVNSLFATSAIGTIPIQFRGLQVRGTNPYDNEDTGIGIYGCTEVGLVDVAFVSGHNGVTSYNSQVMLRNVDFGSKVLDGKAISVKHNGLAYENPGVEEPTSGTVGGAAYNAKNGNIWFASNHSSLSGSPLIKTDLGFVYDFDQEASYGPEQLSFRNQRVNDNSVLANAGLIRLREGNTTRLERIYGGSLGGQLTLISETPITVVSGARNILLSEGTDRELTPGDTLTLVFDGNNWLQTAASRNGSQSS